MQALMDVFYLGACVLCVLWEVSSLSTRQDLGPLFLKVTLDPHNSPNFLPPLPNNPIVVSISVRNRASEMSSDLVGMCHTQRQRTLPLLDRLCGHGFPSHHTSCKSALALPDGPKNVSFISLPLAWLQLQGIQGRQKDSWDACSFYQRGPIACHHGPRDLMLALPTTMFQPPCSHMQSGPSYALRMESPLRTRACSSIWQFCQ